MKKPYLFERLFALAILGGVLAVSIGCGATDENPITPEKMSELRKQEGDQRASFNPGAAKR